MLVVQLGLVALGRLRETLDLRLHAAQALAQGVAFCARGRELLRQGVARGDQLGLARARGFLPHRELFLGVFAGLRQLAAQLVHAGVAGTQVGFELRHAARERLFRDLPSGQVFFEAADPLGGCCCLLARASRLGLLFGALPFQLRSGGDERRLAFAEGLLPVVRFPIARVDVGFQPSDATVAGLHLAFQSRNALGQSVANRVALGELIVQGLHLRAHGFGRDAALVELLARRRQLLLQTLLRRAPLGLTLVGRLCAIGLLLP